MIKPNIKTIKWGKHTISFHLRLPDFDLSFRFTEAHCLVSLDKVSHTIGIQYTYKAKNVDNLLDKLLFGTTNIKSKDHIEGKCFKIISLQNNF